MHNVDADDIVFILHSLGQFLVVTTLCLCVDKSVTVSKLHADMNQHNIKAT